MKAPRQKAQRLGTWAEAWCASVLRIKGYTIAARNQRLPGGEVDIICRRGALLVIVEVKYREKDHNQAALFAISAAKQKRLIMAAQHFLAARSELAHHTLRFDVMLVHGPWWHWAWRTQHIQDAFRP